MEKTGKQIIDLITDHNKSASYMTHALKILGNGNMQKGFTRIENISRKKSI